MYKVFFWGTFKKMNSLMIKSFYLILLFLLFMSTGFSQNIYSKQNLEQSSMEELNAYLKASQRQKKTGTVLSVAGSASVLAGLAVFSATWDEDEFMGYTTGSDIGGWISFAGFITTIVGVPMLITGSSRVKRITRIMDVKSVSFELAPCSFRHSLALNQQSGITLRIRL